MEKLIQVPCEKIKKGETLYQAVCRKIREKTGLYIASKYLIKDDRFNCDIYIIDITE